MRKVLLTGLLAALAAGCGNPPPNGPGVVTVTQTTTSTTTTTAPPTTTTTTSTTTTSTVLAGTAARRYLAFKVAPNFPNDMTLFFNLLGGFTYSVSGVYSTASGIGGAVNGTLSGGTNPLDSGIFEGTLTAELPGCTAERAYTGPLTAQGLQWTAGPVKNSCGVPDTSWPATFTMIKADVIAGALPVSR